jgi:hypothetical protein
VTLGEILTADGWRHDDKKDTWTHPKRQGHIEITPKGWAHKILDINERNDFTTLKEGFSETELQAYLESLTIK